MASANSMRSLMRPTIPISPRVQAMSCPLAAFSTTARVQAGKAAPGKKVQVPKRDNRQPVSTVKKPNPGERKAFRKRIQLSNNSALEVPGLDTLEAGTMTSEASVGKMFAIPNEVQDRLRILEAFKPTQSWGLFRKPHVLLRKEVADLMSKLESSVTDKEGRRLVLTGDRMSGKSIALLQAMAYGLMNDWVVINIPEGVCCQNQQT